jgi:hypothetical protein
MTHSVSHRTHDRASSPGLGAGAGLSRSGRASRPDAVETIVAETEPGRERARADEQSNADEYSYEAQKEDERFHPSIGQSWAPASRDDHVRGLRNSVPDGTETDRVATAELPAEPSFFGVISDAFGTAVSHARHPNDAPPPRELLETEPDPETDFREDPRWQKG